MSEIDVNYGRFLLKVNAGLRYLEKFRILGDAAYRDEKFDINYLYSVLWEVKENLNRLYYELQNEREKNKRQENKIILLESIRKCQE